MLAADLFCAMPSELRTLDRSEATYALVRTTEDKVRSDYTGLAYDRITHVYLYATDGSELICLYYWRSEPPTIGQGVLYGSTANGELIWEGIGKLFE